MSGFCLSSSTIVRVHFIKLLVFKENYLSLIPDAWYEHLREKVGDLSMFDTPLDDGPSDL